LLEGLAGKSSELLNHHTSVEAVIVAMKSMMSAIAKRSGFCFQIQLARFNLEHQRFCGGPRIAI
jgi:hypothetical protein